METGALVGKTFRVLTKEKTGFQMRRVVADESPLEPTLYPKSMWLSIKCAEAAASRGGIGRVSEMPQHRSSRLRDQVAH